MIVDHPATLVTVGDLTGWPPTLFFLGFVVIAALNQRGIIRGTIVGILAAFLLGLPLGLTRFTGDAALPPDLTPTLLGFGFITSALMKLLCSRFREALPAVIGLALIFCLKFAHAGGVSSLGSYAWFPSQSSVDPLRP